MSQREHLRQAYCRTSTAEEYVDRRFASTWGAVLHEAQIAVLNDAIGRHGIRRVLEIAPGPARLSHAVTGFDRGCLCDANASMLSVARRRLLQACQSGERSPTDGQWHLVQCDAFRLPLAGTFDLIYTFRFLRHFRKQDRQALYGEIRSRLKVGGLFICDAVNVEVSLPTRLREGDGSYPIYDELYRRDELVRELATEGFTVLSLTDLIRHFTLQGWLQVYVGPRSHRLAKGLIQLLEWIPGPPLEWVVVCQKSS